jgi:hypothetical protein
VEFRSRGVADVVHKVVAVGSRSVEKAQDFIDEVIGGDKGIRAYGTYEDIYADEVRNRTDPNCLTGTAS